MSQLSAVLEAVRGRVQPDADEREQLEAAASELERRAGEAIDELPVDADVLRAGSTARSTWLAGDRDIDLFVRFPPDLDSQTLERHGLTVGHEILPDGREEYAEHPYVTGEYAGFDVDLVGCFDVAAATEIRSSVDRTPFHTAYLHDRLDDEIANEVRLAKQFLTGIGAYGSDLKTRGYSGYLTELLTLEYGGFVSLLEAAADWTPPIRLDPEAHGTTSFNDPLVVIDPTDPERNVAAVCVASNVARLQHHARAFLDTPTTERFFPPDRAPLDPPAVQTHLRRRGTTPVAVRLDPPDLVPDELWPQLRKSLSGIHDGLEAHGFEVVRSRAMVGEQAVLFFELSVASRPQIEHHEGPPVAVREHAQEFYQTYASDTPAHGTDSATGGEPTADSDSDNRAADPVSGSAGAYGPLIQADRYVVERSREFTDAVSFLESAAVMNVSLGASLTACVEGRDVIAGDGVAELATDFGAEFRDYFEPRYP